MRIAGANTHTLIMTITFPDNIHRFALNLDGAKIYSNINNSRGIASSAPPE